MSDFKKLPCMAGCPVDSGFVDCNGDPIYTGASLATCDDIPAPVEVSVTDTIDGNKIATITVDGVSTEIDETITEIKSFGFDPATNTLTIVYKDESGSEVSKDTYIPQIDAVLHIAPASIDPAIKYPDYYNKIVSGADGLFYGFAPDGTATPLNFLETITSITDVLAYSNKHEIFKYNNESGNIKAAYETVTTLKGIAYDKATSTLSVTYTDEAGDDITKTAVIKAQATAYINAATPASATIFSLETPPTVNDNSLKNNDDYIYIGTDGSYWTWNGTAYVTAPTPAATTEWYVAATTVDAKGDKVNRIARAGWVFIGANKNPQVPLEVERTGTGQYLPIARFLAPANKVATYNSMLVFGTEQAYLNCSDWRFYYAGNGSLLNRIDFGLSGLANPVISYNGYSNTGFYTTNPLSRVDVNGSFGFAIRGSGGSTAQSAQDGTVVMTVAGTTFTLEAPSATVNNRRMIAVKNVSGGTVTVTGNIDLAPGTTLTIPAKGSRIFQSNGTSWFIIGGYL